MRSCGKGSNSPFCACTDYYGNIIPAYKGMFSNVGGTSNYNYYCQADMIEINGDTAADTTVLGLATSLDGKHGGANITNRFFSSDTLPYKVDDIDTDAKFKNTMPLLFYETLILFSLLKSMTVPTIDATTYTCATGRPVYVHYGSYFNGQGKDAFVCMTDENIKKPIFFADPDDLSKDTTKQVPYILYEVRDNDGNPCTTGACTVGGKTDSFDFDNSPGHYIGDVLFKSEGNIQPPEPNSSILNIVLLVGIIVAGFALYGLYYLYMRRHNHEVITQMNKVKPGAGSNAATRASQSKSVNRHPMT